MFRVKDSQTQALNAYFVTRQYNVNLLSDQSSIFGRFIFSRKNGNLVLLAMAEQPALEMIAELLQNSKFAEVMYVDFVNAALGEYQPSKYRNITYFFLLVRYFQGKESFLFPITKNKLKNEGGKRKA